MRQRHKWFSLAGLALVIFFLGPGIALADNCSDLHDCWSTATAASCTSAAAAIAAAIAAVGGLFAGGANGEGDPNLPPAGNADEPIDDPC